MYIGSLFYNDLNWPWQTYNFDSDQSALDALPLAKALETINPDLRAFAAHGGKLLMWAGWEDPQIFVWDTVNFFDYMIHYDAANPIYRELLDLTDNNPEYPYFDDGKSPASPYLGRAAGEAVGPAASAASEAAYTRALTKTDRFAKLYMASGVNHCGGGPGAQSFVTNGNQGELTEALRNWVENDVAPGSIQISKQAGNSATGATQFTTLMCPYPTTLTYSGSGDLLSASSYSCVMPDLATINGP